MGTTTLCFAHCYLTTSYVACCLLPHVCALGFAASCIVYCVLPFMGAAVICGCMPCCHMLCAMGTTASCIACDVLVPQTYCYTVPPVWLLLANVIQYLCTTLLYVITGHGTGNDCIDILSFICTDIILTLLQHCILFFTISIVIMTVYDKILSFPSLYDVMVTLSINCKFYVAFMHSHHCYKPCRLHLLSMTIRFQVPVGPTYKLLLYVM